MFSEAVKKTAELTEVVGAVGKHSYSLDEKLAFTEHFNYSFKTDEYLSSTGKFPLNPKSDDLFEVVSDGIALCKLLNLAEADAVDARSINFPKKGRKLNPWEVTENLNLALETAKAMGIQVVNMGAQDLADVVGRGTQYLVLGLVWQVVKLQLLKKVDLRSVPELVALLKEGEELGDLIKLPAEETLLRWVNFHLDKAGSKRRVKNFSFDLRDSVVIAIVLERLGAPGLKASAVERERDVTARAAQVIEAARRMEVPAMIQPIHLVRGNKRLNMAFCAQIFNTKHGLEGEVKEEALTAALEAAATLDKDDDASGSREERSYKMWINSLNIDGAPLVTSLEEGWTDGILLCRLINRIAPGLVNPKFLNADPAKMNRFQRIEVCNHAVDICNKHLALNIPGVGGVDIAEGNRKSLESIIWQLMRLQINNMLKEVGGGVVPKDADIIKWANELVASVGAEGVDKLTAFKDKHIGSSVFLLTLLRAIAPRAVNPDLVTPGETEEDKKNNARYVIAVARKIGAPVFCTWEDITAVRAKIVGTLLASIMLAAKRIESSGGAAAAGGAAAGGGGAASH
jgi:plastin-1